MRICTYMTNVVSLCVMCERACEQRWCFDDRRRRDVIVNTSPSTSCGVVVVAFIIDVRAKGELYACICFARSLSTYAFLGCITPRRSALSSLLARCAGSGLLFCMRHNINQKRTTVYTAVLVHGKYLSSSIVCMRATESKNTRIRACP